jgi:uncharacterized protein YjbI with pentapeptide repeats
MKHTIVGFGCLLLMGLSLQGCGLFLSDLEKLLETNVCQKCDLTGANLKGADLTGTDLTKANLWGANLNNANLTDADLIDAILQNAENFNTANTTGAKFCKTIMPDGITNNAGC